MKRIFKWVAIALGALVVAGALLFALDPSIFIYRLASAIGIPSEVGEAPDLAPGVRWQNDYFAIEYIDDQTIAIGEPRYKQRNVSYLILGKSRAVLFDTGPGIRDIKAIVRGLTDLPVTAVASHLHYDHVSGLGQFDEAAILDAPQLRKQVSAGADFAFEGEQHLGAIEGIPASKFKVDVWLKSGGTLELGDRSLQIIATPGHTPDSLMLYDPKRKQLFTGDFIYPGFLLTILPGANLGRYLETSATLLSTIVKDASLFPGHGSQDPGPWRAPLLAYKDLVDLNLVLMKMRDKKEPAEGLFPRKFVVNSQIVIWAPFSWNEEW